MTTLNEVFVATITRRDYQTVRVFSSHAYATAWVAEWAHDHWPASLGDAPELYWPDYQLGVPWPEDVVLDRYFAIGNDENARFEVDRYYIDIGVPAGVREPVEE